MATYGIAHECDSSETEDCSLDLVIVIIMCFNSRSLFMWYSGIPEVGTWRICQIKGLQRCVPLFGVCASKMPNVQGLVVRTYPNHSLVITVLSIKYVDRDSIDT